MTSSDFLLRFQMEFRLSAPRYWFSPGYGEFDWIYLAGGAYGTRNGKDVSVFEKINVLTGELVQLEDIRSPSFYCHLIKW